MAEIGATLREARMRQRIDITDMEVRTKIRAKYLRALENEEWDLLPGPTYVRSFLRTYAEALGLDAKLLVEEYKLRHDQLEAGDLHPMRRPSARERERRRQRQPRGVPRGAILGVVLVAIFAALFLIGKGQSTNDDTPESVMTQPATTTQPTAAKKSKTTRPAKRQKRAAASRVVRLQVVATTVPVSVCLTDVNGDVLAGNVVVQPGQRSKTYRSKRFSLVLGSSTARLRIDGRTRALAPLPGPVALRITKKGRVPLPPGRRPTCGGA